MKLTKINQSARVPQNQRCGFGSIVATCFVATVGLFPISGTASTTDFEIFTTGVSVNYQGPPPGSIMISGPYTIPDPYGSLWTVVDEWGLGRLNDGNPATTFDEAVVDDGGNIVWRFSNAVGTFGFSDSPNSPSSAPAGESTASLWNDRGNNHTVLGILNPRAAASTPYFHGGFKFKSATGTPQPGLRIEVNPNPRQSSYRLSYVSIRDDGANGFDLVFFDTDAAAGFVGTTIAEDLSYTDWHQIDIHIEFVDGLNGDGSGNDIVTVQVNGSTVHTGTTWETYYVLPSPVAVDALMFRADKGVQAPGTAGAGFFFDNVVVDNAQLSSAEVLACVGFKPPLDNDVVVKKKNRVLPLRMNLENSEGELVSDITPPVVDVQYVGAYVYGAGELEELESNGKGDEGNRFEFNGSNWAFNLSTKGLAAGTYIVTAVSGDLGEYIIDPACEVVIEIE